MEAIIIHGIVEHDCVESSSSQQRIYHELFPSSRWHNIFLSQLSNIISHIIGFEFQLHTTTSILENF